MVHHTYNPISIIAALLANSCHRLHSVLSHPHIRCNPHQPVPAGVPGWGSRMENSSLHWHSWETENSDFGKSEPLVKPPQLKTPLYHLCFLRAQGRDGCSMFFSSTLSYSPTPFCLPQMQSQQPSSPYAQLQKCSTWREWCLPLKQHLKQHKSLRKQSPCWRCADG